MADQFFYVVGIITCSLGAFALFGLIAWKGVEWWVSFNTIRGPLMRFYADELQKRSRTNER